MAKPGPKPRVPTCHPERKYEAKGLCNACYQKEYKAQKSRTHWWLKTKYGLTYLQFLTMSYSQGGKCALCERQPKVGRLQVDHDHETKKVRGLLCYPCNRFKVGSNTIEDAKAVLQYLSRDFDGRSL